MYEHAEQTIRCVNNHTRQCPLNRSLNGKIRFAARVFMKPEREMMHRKTRRERRCLLTKKCQFLY